MELELICIAKSYRYTLFVKVFGPYLFQRNKLIVKHLEIRGGCKFNWRLSREGHLSNRIYFPATLLTGRSNLHADHNTVNITCMHEYMEKAYNLP